MKKLTIEKWVLLGGLLICLYALVRSGIEVNALTANIKDLEYKNSRQAAQLKDFENLFELQDILIRTQEDIISDYIFTEPTLMSAEEFEITYYCPCFECCGKTDGITASGTLAIEGQTIAADWDMLPPGTKLFIDGIGFRTVEDKGGVIKGKKIDVFMNSHTAVLEAGIHKAKVYIVEGY